MKKRSFLTSKGGIAVLAAAAVVLLGISSVTGARAALQYRSEIYASQVEMYDIGVSLLENGEANENIVSHRNYNSRSDNGTWDKTIPGKLLEHMLSDAGETSIQPGKKYPEEILVKNTGTIDEYVRVTIYKYWLDKDGNVTEGYLGPEELEGRKKTQTSAPELTPDLIDLHLINESDWIKDESASTAERTVLYYAHRLDANAVTQPLSDTFSIDGSIATKVNQTTEADGTIRTTYAYDGYSYVLEAKVDAVQDHNAEAAIQSAWGRAVEINGTELRLR